MSPPPAAELTAGEPPRPAAARCRGWGGVGLLAVVAVVWTAVLVSPIPDRVLGWGGEGRFFDLRGTLAAAELAHRGGNPYAFNPLDPAGRPHLYSSWWLALGRGLDRTDTNAAGLGLTLVLLGVALACWWPRTRREALIEAAVLVSPAWLLAVYRGNIDLAIFALLAVTIACFARAGPRAHVAAAALAGVVGILKYFPAAAVVGCLGARRRREGLMLAAVFVLVLLAGYPSLVPALAVLGRYAPQAFGLHTFGATMLAGALPVTVPGIAAVVLAVAMAALGWWTGGSRGAWTDDDAAAGSMLAAAVSAAVVVACFGIGSSFTYKVIFLWWFVRWLARDAAARLGPRRAFALLGLLVALCWADGITAALVNGLAAGLPLSGRRAVLVAVHAETVLVQLGWWCLIGACTRVLVDWSRGRLQRWA